MKHTWNRDNLAGSLANRQNCILLFLAYFPLRLYVYPFFLGETLHDVWVFLTRCPLVPYVSSPKKHLEAKNGTIVSKRCPSTSASISKTWFLKKSKSVRTSAARVRTRRWRSWFHREIREDTPSGALGQLLYWWAGDKHWAEFRTSGDNPLWLVSDPNQGKSSERTSRLARKRLSIGGDVGVWFPLSLSRCSTT